MLAAKSLALSPVIARRRRIFVAISSPLSGNKKARHAGPAPVNRAVSGLWPSRGSVVLADLPGGSGALGARTHPVIQLSRRLCACAGRDVKFFTRAAAPCYS